MVSFIKVALFLFLAIALYAFLMMVNEMVKEMTGKSLFPSKFLPRLKRAKCEQCEFCRRICDNGVLCWKEDVCGYISIPDYCADFKKKGENDVLQDMQG